jgi:hypothetical protein
MTDQSSPITPPPELVGEWLTEAADLQLLTPSNLRHLATRAAQWGADQELEACCEWAKHFNYDDEHYEDKLRAARRPKPPSLKKQALRQLDTLNADLAMHGRGCDLSQIRRALEQLND